MCFFSLGSCVILLSHNFISWVGPQQYSVYATCSLLLCQDLPHYFPSALWITIFLLFFQIVCSLALGSFPHMHTPISVELFCRTICRSLGFSVCSLLSLIFCLWTPTALIALSSHLHLLSSGSPGFFLGSPPHTSLWNSSNAVGLGNLRVHLIFFCVSEITSFRCLLPSVLDIILSFILYGIIVCFKWEGNSGFCYLILSWLYTFCYLFVQTGFFIESASRDFECIL